MKINKMLLILLFVVFAVPEVNAAEVKKIKVGILPTSSMLPLFLADEKGWYKEAGLEVELTKMRGGATILPAIAGDSISKSYVTMLTRVTKRKPTKWEVTLPRHLELSY
jgi:ABC-type nitrate/sulfonate/bicarbonate transport system substrate-binding protein